MIGIVICAHGVFSDGLHSSLQLIAGKQENLEIVNFEESSNTEELKEALEKALNKVEKGSGSVVFTDIPGGTPYNQAALLSAANRKIRVVSGTNLPCLLTACFSREVHIDEFIAQVIQSGKDSISEFIVDSIQPQKPNNNRGGI